MLIEPCTSSRRAFVTGLPLSSASSSANSSACCSRRSPSRQTRRERSPGKMRDQGPASKARRAAATAASISALSPAGTWAMTSSVAGSSTETVSPLRSGPLPGDQELVIRGEIRGGGRAERRFADGDRHGDLPCFWKRRRRTHGGFRYISLNIASRGARQEPNCRRLCVALTPHSQKTSPPPSGQHLWEDRVRCDKVEKPCVF